MQVLLQDNRTLSANTAVSACGSSSALFNEYNGTVFAVPFFAFSRFFTYFYYYFIKRNTAKCRKCFD